MRTVNAKKGCVIPLGRLGENEATIVVFDIAGWKDCFGEGTFSLLNQRNGDAQAYPCVIEQTNTEVRWEVKNSDVSQVGYGKCELYYTVGNTLAKSEIWTTVVGTALTGGGEVPEPWEDWVEQVLAAGAEVEAFLTTLEGGTVGQVWTKTEDGAKWADPTGGGEGTTDHRQLTNRSAANQHPISAIDGLQSELDGKQPTISDLTTIRTGAALGATALQSVPNTYRTAAEQDVIDSGKQDTISDLADIRSGAALGETALQSVPNTYRTATAQDSIDDQKQPKTITDTGGYFTTDTVEGALQEIGAELSGVNTLLGSGVIS